jgi:hypothetical protein
MEKTYFQPETNYFQVEMNPFSTGNQNYFIDYQPQFFKSPIKCH